MGEEKNWTRIWRFYNPSSYQSYHIFWIDRLNLVTPLIQKNLLICPPEFFSINFTEKWSHHRPHWRNKSIGHKQGEKIVRVSLITSEFGKRAKESRNFQWVLFHLASTQLGNTLLHQTTFHNLYESYLDGTKHYGLWAQVLKHLKGSPMQWKRILNPFSTSMHQQRPCSIPDLDPTIMHCSR